MTSGWFTLRPPSSNARRQVRAICPVAHCQRQLLVAGCEPASSAQHSAAQASARVTPGNALCLKPPWQSLRPLALNQSPGRSGQLYIVSFYSFQPQSPKEQPFPGGAGKAGVELPMPRGPAIWMDTNKGRLLTERPPSSSETLRKRRGAQSGVRLRAQRGKLR